MHQAPHRPILRPTGTHLQLCFRKTPASREVRDNAHLWPSQENISAGISQGTSMLSRPVWSCYLVQAGWKGEGLQLAWWNKCQMHLKKGHTTALPSHIHLQVPGAMWVPRSVPRLICTVGSIEVVKDYSSFLTCCLHCCLFLSASTFPYLPLLLLADTFLPLSHFVSFPVYLLIEPAVGWPGNAIVPGEGTTLAQKPSKLLDQHLPVASTVLCLLLCCNKSK